jgi:hypothetical protein
MRETLLVICPTGQAAFLRQIGTTGKMGIGVCGNCASAKYTAAASAITAEKPAYANSNAPDLLRSA